MHLTMLCLSRHLGPVADSLRRFIIDASILFISA
jgi:hypothetical protein